MTRAERQNRLGAPRAALTLSTLASVAFLPWPFAALLALSGAVIEPLLPLSAGLLADTLYYAPRWGELPLFTIFGAAATALAFLVRSRLSAGSIRR